METLQKLDVDKRHAFLRAVRVPLAADLQGDLCALNEHAPAQAVLCPQRLINLSQGIYLHAGGSLWHSEAEKSRRSA